MNNSPVPMMNRQTPSPMKMPQLPQPPQSQPTQMMNMNSPQQQQSQQQVPQQQQMNHAQQLSLTKAELDRANALRESVNALAASTASPSVQMQNHIQNQNQSPLETRSLDQQISQAQMTQLNQAQMNQSVASVTNQLQARSPMGRQSPNVAPSLNRTSESKDIDMKPSPPRSVPTPPQFSQAGKVPQPPQTQQQHQNFRSGIKTEMREPEDVKMASMTSSKNDLQNQAIKEEKPKLMQVHG